MDRMLTATFIIHTHRSPEESFSYLSDLGHQPQWRHDVTSSELEHGAPGEPGSKWRQEVRTGPLPRPHERHVVLAAAQPNTHLVVRTVDDALLRAEGTYHLEPDGNGTTISVTTSLAAARPAGNVALRAIGRHFRTTVERYRTQLQDALDGAFPAGEGTA